MSTRRAKPARAPRLYCPAMLAEGVEAVLTAAQTHYLVHVLRLGVGAPVRLFNGAQGEWDCIITALARKSARLACRARLRPPSQAPDIDYVFAPLKAARLDYMAQKATEMGARRLRPVITERTVATRVNLDRLAANAIEAAEQCNLVAIPEVLAPEKLPAMLAGWDPARRLIFCDESGAGDPLAALGAIAPGPLAVLVGPEGGFAPGERDCLLAAPFAHPVHLGPRIMRADTAAVAALALVQAVLGDWGRAGR